MLRAAAVASLLCSLCQAQPKLQVERTSNGIRFGYLGAKPAAPRPTVLFLGSAVEDGLTQPHFLQGAETLGGEVLSVTLDLPGHGESRQAGEPAGLDAWRHRLDRNLALTSDLTARARELLDHLIANRFTDPARIAAFGTSRGGFMAFHLAAVDPRVRLVAAFAPVTNLLVLREFHEMKEPERARAIAANTLAGSICDRGVWMIIGSTDDRVGTDDAIAFSQRFIESARAHGLRPNLELHVERTEGHRVPDGSYRRAAQWLRTQWGL
ncbi:MAG: prolyl oligopeptidase family serine peptidase [Bryobacteraceae bacterium]